MAREPKYGVTLNGWERLLASCEANAKDFPQLETYRALLLTMLLTALSYAHELMKCTSGFRPAPR